MNRTPRQHEQHRNITKPPLPSHTKPTINEFMTRWVSRDIDLCIGCNRCMEACPVSKEHFSIGELNVATEVGTEVPESIREFAWNCVQCGRCVPVCPAGARRDYMVLFIKHKLRGQKPKSYEKYLNIKGPFLGSLGRIEQKLYVVAQKAKHRDIARFMETLPSEKAPVLFYPGCYVYNTELVRRSLLLLDHVGEPYAVLAGLSTCCGVPQLLQGEFELADNCIDSLHEKIKKSAPTTVITACAECFEALLRIRAKFDEEFEVLTVAEYLLRYIDRFPEIALREKLTLHDSCRITRRYKRGGAAREMLSRFGEFVEMENARDATMCCYHWNHGHDPANVSHRRHRLAEAKECAPTMVCDCITCYEEYIEPDTGVEVLELLQLFEEALASTRTREVDE